MKSRRSSSSASASRAPRRATSEPTTAASPDSAASTPASTPDATHLNGADTAPAAALTAPDSAHATSTPTTTVTPQPRRANWPLILLGVAVFFGVLLRFHNPNWDNYGLFHPDEGNTDSAVSRVHFFYPLGQKLQLDPDFFAYGGLSIYLYRITCEFVAMRTGNLEWLQNSGYINIVGRLYSAFFSALVMIPLWYLVRRIFKGEQGKRIALCTLLLYAFCATSIQMAHYDTTESILALLITLIALVSFRLAERPSFTNYVLMGLLGGLSLATKMSALSFAVFPLAGHVIAIARAQSRILRQRRRETEAMRAAETAKTAQSKTQRRRSARQATADEMEATTLVVEERPSWRESIAMVWLNTHAFLLFCVLIAFTLFFVGSPYTFVDSASHKLVAFTPHLPDASLAQRFLNPKLVDSMHYEGGVVDGSVPVNYTLQFDGTPSYTFWLYNLFWQLGLVAAPCIVGVPLLFGWGLAKRDYRPLLLLSFPIAYFAYIGRWHTKFNRYMIPIVPFLLIAGAWVLISLWDWHAQRANRVLTVGEAPSRAVPWGRVVTGAMVALTVFWGLAFSSIYWREQSRYTASRWIYDHVPIGNEIIREHWDYGLPAPLKMPSGETRSGRPDYPTIVGADGDDTGLRVYDAEQPIEIKADYYARELSKAPYMAIASRRLYGTLPRLTEKFPLTGRYYRLLFAGKLGYTRVATFTSYPSLFGITIPDDNAEETMQVFDHPKCIIFQNTGHFTEDQIRNLLLSEKPPTDSLPYPR